MKKFMLFLCLTSSTAAFGMMEEPFRMPRIINPVAEETLAMKFEKIQDGLFFLFNAVIKKAVNLIIVNNNPTREGTPQGLAFLYIMGDTTENITPLRKAIIEYGIQYNQQRLEALKQTRLFYQHWVRFENYQEKSLSKIRTAIQTFLDQIREKTDPTNVEIFLY